jgi:hypothetical protein
MKRNRAICLVLVFLFLLVIPSQEMSAAPAPQRDTDEAIQIVLVLDVSGSMGTPVYTGIVPEDLLSLLLRMDELKNNPEYLDLEDQMEEAENDPAVVSAKKDWDDAFEELSTWITEYQSVSLPGIQSQIRSKLQAADCDDSVDQAIATAQNYAQIDFYLNSACPYGTTYSQRMEIYDLVPYLAESEYQELRSTWQEAYVAYDEALEESGYNSFSQQLEDYKASGDFQQIQDEIDRLVEVYSIPSRLDLAKSAAVNLIDLSRLDKNNTGIDSLIGLVTFSNQAMFEHGLTLKHEELKSLIMAMSPLQQTNIGDALTMGLNELINNADPDQPKMVILLSDGHANVGLSSSEILAVIPPRANEHEIILCTAGFADIESEVDFVLLEGLAFQTNGEYLFTNSGTELGSFFAACREAAAGKELAGQMTGIVDVGDIREVGRIEVERNTCALNLVLNFLSGKPKIELEDPEGKVVSSKREGTSYQTKNQVQLLSIENPPAGEWMINISNEGSADMDAAFSLVVSTTPCDDTSPIEAEETALDIPYLISEGAMSTVTGAVILIVVLLVGGTAYVILIRQRRGSQ